MITSNENNWDPKSKDQFIVKTQQEEDLKGPKGEPSLCKCWSWGPPGFDLSAHLTVSPYKPLSILFQSSRLYLNPFPLSYPLSSSRQGKAEPWSEAPRFPTPRLTSKETKTTLFW